METKPLIDPNYVPYGPEWEAEMMSNTKAKIVKVAKGMAVSNARLRRDLDEARKAITGVLNGRVVVNSIAASQDYVSKAALNYAEQVLSKLSVK